MPVQNSLRPPPRPLDELQRGSDHHRRVDAVEHDADRRVAGRGREQPGEATFPGLARERRELGAAHQPA